MSWLYLIAASLCEIVYAAAMPRTAGFTRLGPSLFCLGFIAACMYLLSLATRSIPVGTAYAVWVGIGAVGTTAAGRRPLRVAHGLLRPDPDGHRGHEAAHPAQRHGGLRC